MRRPFLLCTAPLLALGLTACETDGYYGGGVGYYEPYPYYGWYDGYYGSIYDGYWGNDNFFYYRMSDRDRHFRRGDRDHFRRDQDTPGGNWRSMRGTLNPDRSYRMPHYPRGGHDRDRH